MSEINFHLAAISASISVLALMSLLSHIFSATAASEGLGNPVARAS